MTAITHPSHPPCWGSDFEIAYASPVIVESQGADMPSIVRHNRKKTRPRSHYDEAGKMGQDGRQRRSRGSSDDEGKMTPDGLCNEDLRVGGPGLCSIPPSTTIPPNESSLSSLPLHRSSDGQILWTRIHRLLANRNVSLYSGWTVGESISICLRQSECQPEPHLVPTVLITAIRQKVDNSWLKAVRDIRKLLAEENFKNISVEIQDPQALSPPITSPILPSDQIHRHWDDVLARILTMFRTTVGLQEILSIGCYRRGRSQDTSENAPTVLVMVETTSRRDWKVPRDFITQILSDCSLPNVAVEIVKDRIDPLHQVSGFNREILNAHVVPGGPIAPLQNQNVSGTLGGFIELRGQDGRWRRFALICFHVIDIDEREIGDDTDATMIARWRRNGFPPFDHRRSESEFSVLARNMQVSHPSLLARAEQDKIDHDIIEATEKSSFYQEGLVLHGEGVFHQMSERSRKGFHVFRRRIDDARASVDFTANFFGQSQNVLGTVSAGSGFRTVQCHNREGNPYLMQADWAIIDIDQRWGVSNKLADDTGLWRVASRISLENMTASSGEADRELHFQGYRSGRSKKVLYSGLETAKIVPPTEPGGESIVTLEHSICGKDNNPPAIPGDSGALLFRDMGSEQEVVGMIFAGCAHNQISYFTRIDELSADIMRSTGATAFQMYNQ